jgi:hypothetical protein
MKIPLAGTAVLLFIMSLAKPGFYHLSFLLLSDCKFDENMFSR